LGQSYRHVWGRIKAAEHAHGTLLVETQVGGQGTRRSHLGGVHALFCDGHTQFIKDSINVLVWQRLGSRNGGEVISADAY
jgi:prepilin-type processing-associated H-X9-DG protein